MLRTHSVAIERRVRAAMLHWPTSQELESDSQLGGNRHYQDLRATSWQAAKDALSYERCLLSRLAKTQDQSSILDFDNEDFQFEVSAYLSGLDVGVASASLALAAAHCIPCSSCNGGLLNEGHAEEYPLVVFFCRRRPVKHLLAAAEAAKIGLVNESGGALVAYSGSLNDMLNFATEIINRRNDFEPQKASLFPSRN